MNGRSHQSNCDLVRYLDKSIRPGARKPPDEAVERLVSHGPDMGMEPEQEERESAVALAKAAETAAANSLSAGGWGEAARDLGSALERFSARPSW